MLKPEEETLAQRLDRLRPVYIGVFLAQAIAAGAVITWREWAVGGHTNPYDLMIAVILKMDDVAYLALVTSVLIVDFGRYIMGLLLKAPQDRAREQGLALGKVQGIAEGKVQGKAEGLAEGKVVGAAEERERWMDYDRRVQEWEREQKEAQDKGEPFDEPRPKPPIS